jgi:hypothetical protein
VVRAQDYLDKAEDGCMCRSYLTFPFVGLIMILSVENYLVYREG